MACYLVLLAMTPYISAEASDSVRRPSRVVSTAAYVMECWTKRNADTAS